VQDVEDTSAFVDYLIREHDTIVVPGHFFQAPQHIRVAYGGDTEIIREALARLARALSDF
jgi:aspartate/methionine/tyrosine aminotransferase